MENQELIAQCTATAQQWIDSPLYDAETKQAVKAMIEAEDKTPLIDAFYRSLEFGTGGLRGIMGPGTNRMNVYVVGAATQGLANYLLKNFADRVCLQKRSPMSSRPTGLRFTSSKTSVPLPKFLSPSATSVANRV